MGADNSNDAVVLTTASSLYEEFSLKRIYYSAYSPIPDASRALPAQEPPLQREHRLYQADWLLRFYGYSASEILSGTVDNMLDADIDPKLNWALLNRQRFPIDINTADRQMLLRVPGLGVRSVDRLILARRHSRLRLNDLKRLAGSVQRLRPFVVTDDHRPTNLLDRADLRTLMVPRVEQFSLF